jgi:hypothetical protein
MNGVVGARRAAPLLGTTLVAAAVLAVACSSDDAAQPTPTGSPTTAMQGDTCVSYEDFAGPFLLNWCVGCHSSSLDEAHRKMAPLDMNFDTLEGVRAHADRIKVRVSELKNMPPLGGPSDEDRALLAEWIDCDLPSTSGGFVPPAPIGGPMAVTPPTGACADPRMAVPETILPRCTAETHSCVLQCATTPEYDQEACRNACLAADTTPADSSLGVSINCATCTLGQLLACADSGGCHDETAAFMCCIEPCAGDEACTAACNGELQAFGLCVYYTAPQCVDYANGPISECFAAGPVVPDAGTPPVGDAG